MYGALVSGKGPHTERYGVLLPKLPKIFRADIEEALRRMCSAMITLGSYGKQIDIHGGSCIMALNHNLPNILF